MTMLPYVISAGRKCCPSKCKLTLVRQIVMMGWAKCFMHTDTAIEPVCAVHCFTAMVSLPTALYIMYVHKATARQQPCSQQRCMLYICIGVVGQELCEATAPYNLFWPTGFIGSVGVAGAPTTPPPRLPHPPHLRTRQLQRSSMSVIGEA